jgi:hypothetical protein
MDPLDTPSALEKQIEQLEALRSVLGDALTDAKKAELKDRLRALIETAGGAVILRDVQAGRDVVGRDRIEVNVALAPQGPPEPLLAAYYRSLADECRRLPLGVIDTQFVRTANEASIPLPDIYVDLDVVAPAAPRATKRNAPGPTAYHGRKGRRASLSSPPWPRPRAPAPSCSGTPARANRRSSATWPTSSRRARRSCRRCCAAGWSCAWSCARSPIPAGSKSGTAEMLWDALREDISRQVGTEATGRLFFLPSGTPP